MLAFCSNKDFFKSPFIQRWLEKNGVCCYHGDSMAMTPETTFLTTFQTMESVLTAVHTEHLFTKWLSQFPIVNTMKHCNGQRGKLSSIPLYHTLKLVLYKKIPLSKSFNTLFRVSWETMHNLALHCIRVSFTLRFTQCGPTQC